MVGTRLIASVELTLRFELVVRRLDPGGSRELGRLDLGPPDWDVTAIDSAASGSIVWVSSRDGTVRAVDVTTMEVVRRWPVGSAVSSIAVRADGSLVAYGTTSGIVCLRRVRDGALLQCVHDSSAEITAVDFGDDELITATSSGTVTRWRVPSLEIKESRELGEPVSAIANTTDGTLAVAVGGRPGKVKISRGRLLIVDESKTVECVASAGPLTSVAWLSEHLLVTTSLDGTIRLMERREHGCGQAALARFGQPLTFAVDVPPSAQLVVGLWSKGRTDESVVLLHYLSPSQ